MKHEDFEERLHDYLDGELDAEQKKLVEHTLTESEEAQALYDDLIRLRDQARLLARPQLPERDLWEDIAPRLTPREAAPAHRGHFGWAGMLALAATVAIVAGVAFLLPELETADPGMGPQAQEHTETMTWQEEVARADQQYQKTRAVLTAAIEERESDLSPETLAVLEKNLAAIDTAVTEIRTAMASDPNEPLLLRLLVATQEKELNMLQRILEAPQGS
jgi:anti-sigma factor RsiW